MVNTISFPMLQIGPFEINRVVFSIGPITVYWYGLIICTGLILGLLYMLYRFGSFGLDSDDLTDVALVVVPSAVVGARLYYVLTSLDEFSSFYEMIAIWDGGIAIYGAVIAGAVALYCVCRVKKYPTLKVFDSIAPAVMLGQIVGRWGNFVNAEAYGAVGTYEFFGKSFDFAKSSRNPFLMSINGTLVQPTFLYESAWNLAGFILINIFYNRKSFDGEVLLWYLSWYGLGRCFIEGFRTDSLYIGSIRISQLVAFVCFAAGVGIIAYVRARQKANKKA